jgi:ATP-dependent Clp protease ATP-binding subunit ClpA
MEKAWGFAQIMKLKEIDPEHILLAIIEEEHGVASFVCEALLIDAKSMRSELISAMSWKNRKLGVSLP